MAYVPQVSWTSHISGGGGGSLGPEFCCHGSTETRQFPLAPRTGIAEAWKGRGHNWTSIALVWCKTEWAKRSPCRAVQSAALLFWFFCPSQNCMGEAEEGSSLGQKRLEKRVWLNARLGVWPGAPGQNLSPQMDFPLAMNLGFGSHCMTLCCCLKHIVHSVHLPWSATQRGPLGGGGDVAPSPCGPRMFQYILGSGGWHRGLDSKGRGLESMHQG